MKNAFTVSPMSQSISLKPGETYDGSIMVANPAAATEDFYYVVEVHPYSILGDSYETDFQTMSDWSRIVEWITLDDAEGVLKPNETKKVHFTINVPKNAPGGGQYAMLGVRSNTPIDDASKSAVQSVYEMASLLHAEVAGDVKHEGKIIENQIPGFVAEGKPSVTTKLSNTGNVHETAEISITVKNNFTGEMIYPRNNEDNTFESIVMPESTKTVSRELGSLPVLGIVEVSETVHYMGDELGTTGIMIICPVWFILLVLATILSIVGMVCYGVHLKHKKSQKVVDF